MSIIRTSHSKENPFAQVCKKSLWDNNLSLEAVGLWARLMSRPDNWTICINELTKSSNVSKKIIYRILKELIKFGYAIGIQEKNAAGKYGKIEYIIFEEPVLEEEIKKMFPISRFRLSGFPLSGNWYTTNIELTKKEEERDKESILTDAKEKEAIAPFETPPPPIPKIITLPKAEKERFGRFKRVQLTSDQFNKLFMEYGKSKTEDYIQRVDFWLEEGNGKNHKNHYATILKWIDKDLKNPKPFQKQEPDRRQRYSDGTLMNPDYKELF